MIETVARAILKARYFDREPEGYDNFEGFLSGLYPENRDEAYDEARAAIEAMREPTEGIESVFGKHGLLVVWDELIDAALKEEG
jgi:hypothetical protein